MLEYYYGVWELEYTDEFETWWDDLDISQQIAFDPLRHAILLCGGNKTGLWNAWSRTAINQADDLYDIHLQTLKEEDHGQEHS